MTVAAVAFDLDYTLAVPTRDRQALLDEATAAADAPAFSRAAYLDAHRRTHATETREPIFAELLAETDETPPELSAGALARAYRETVEASLTPVPGARALLEDLSGEYHVGLLTDGPARAQQGKLDTLGWNALFDAVVITGTLDAAKPDPRAFDALLDALSVPAARTVYVGDDPGIDVAGANAAGLYTVEVRAPDASEPAVSGDRSDDEPDSEADAVLARDALAERLPEIVAGFE